jgi:hypothetical protein
MEGLAKMDIKKLCWLGVSAIKEKMEESEKHVKETKGLLACFIENYGEDDPIVKDTKDNLAIWEGLWKQDREDYTVALKIYNEVEQGTK